MADSSQAEMRIWARANGFAISDRGRVPRAVTQAFLAAQAAGSADAAPSGDRRAPVVRVPARSQSGPEKSAKPVDEVRAHRTSRPRGSRPTSVRAAVAEEPESAIPESAEGEQAAERSVVTKRHAAGSGRRRGSGPARSGEQGEDPVRAEEVAVELPSGAVGEAPPMAASSPELAELRARLATLESKLADLTALVSGPGRRAGRQALLRRLRR